MQFTYWSHQIYRPDPARTVMRSSCLHLYTLLNSGANDLIDYLMVIALFLLLVVLSLPTIVQLTGFLTSDRAMPNPKSADPLVGDAPSYSRLSPVRSPAGPVDRGVAETQLAL